MLTAERLRELVTYDPETGVMRWRVSRRGKIKPGNIAGYSATDGYLQITVDRRTYMLHRLAWLYVHGEWPSLSIDHINGVRDDNRIVNLRPATVAQQRRNICLRSDNTSGLPGVRWIPQKRRWIARIKVNSVYRHLGCFHDKLAAKEAYERAAEKYFGEFASHLSRRPVASPSNANGDNLQ
ncbi:protein of unknown function [Hyphomicrobium sp. 1Nfss2.1]|uniref:HNH endonuclease n=1 Tax=Hyphomicrobium sp. 1Nfss2.1 TaxID=3413936 RepID=UPI003C7CD5CC